MDKIFYCYSKPLKDFLVENQERYFSSAIHNKTKKKFWMFNGNEKLNNLLTVWSKRKDMRGRK